MKERNASILALLVALGERYRALFLLGNLLSLALLFLRITLDLIFRTRENLWILIKQSQPSANVL